MLTLEELKRMTAKELEQELQKHKLELFKIRLAVQSRQEKNTAKIKNLRKYISRLRTMERMLKMEQAPENPRSSVTK